MCIEKIEEILKFQYPVELKKENTQLKKTSTGLNKILIGYNKQLLTNNDLKIVQKAEAIVEKLIRKRVNYTNKKEKEIRIKDRTVMQNIKRLRSIIDGLDMETKVKYIIAIDSSVINDFEYRYERFLEEMAEYMYRDKKTVDEIIAYLNSVIKNTEHESYADFLQTIRESLRNM